MQFVLNGPDMPDELLQAHEEGKVVFFCGAGVSRQLGLPDFRGLVERIRVELGDEPNEEEQKLIGLARWDAALDYLEKKYPDPHRIRKALVKVLSVCKTEENTENYDTHRSLLTLARTRNVGRKHNDVHLVTTNFDRAFETIRSEFDWNFQSYAAPFLPLPKETNWNGIVYLHGLIPSVCHPEDSLRDLVVTSGGFGRAYLSERWASRFVSELLRNYVVCFVGYSLSDPVMHYLIDAVEADRALGEKTNPVYLFLDKDETKKKPEFSRNKTVVLVTYDAQNDHQLLHSTLKKWADSYRRGSRGKIAIIDAESSRDPSVEPNTGYQERVVWAISDMGGAPAGRFAEQPIAPPIGWLDVLEKVELKTKTGRKEASSALRFEDIHSDTDRRSAYLFEWCIRYLNHPMLIERCVRCGMYLNRYFRGRVLFWLSEYDKLKALGKEKELEEIRRKSPFAIPGKFASKIWHLLILGRLLPSNERHIDILSLVERVKSGEMDWFLVNRIADCFAPCVRVKKSWRESQNGLGTGVKDYFEWEFECVESHNAYFSKEIRAALPSDCEVLLRVMLDRLQRGLDDACYLDPLAECGCRMAFDIPSIEDHFQNGESGPDWRCSIDIVRDAWLKIADKYPGIARGYYRSWIRSHHYLLRRLALFAARRNDVIDSAEWVNDVVVEHGFLLWQPFVKRELCRLLASAGKINKRALNILTGAILKGPPPCMFLRLNGTEEERRVLRDRMIWLRLAKLEESHCVLPSEDRTLLDALKQKYGWKCSKWQQEEFLGWHSGTGCPDYEEERYVVHLPSEVEELACALNDPKVEADIAKWGCEGDDFDQKCKMHPEDVISALKRLSTDGVWKTNRLKTVLREWRNPDLFGYSETLLNALLPVMPDEVFYDLAGVLGDWAEEGARTKRISKDLLFDVADRIIRKPYSTEEDKVPDNGFGPIGAAINHPVGKIVEALLDFSFPERIHKDDGIKEPWIDLFSKVCETDRGWTRHGHVILASRCVALYYADERWACANLLPKLSWRRNESEAFAAWAGFIRVHDLHAPLLNHLKQDLFECVEHLGQYVEEDARRYCSLVTAMGVIGTEGYEYCDYRGAFLRMTVEWLEYCAHALVEILESRRKPREVSSDERWTAESCWYEQIKPFMHEVWPKDIAKRTPRISSLFCRLVCSSGSAFTDALEELSMFIVPVDEHSYFLHVIESEGLCRKYPEGVLKLLSITIDTIQWSGSQLRGLMDEIVAASAPLSLRDEYCRLDELLRQAGC